jgi:hypothetical protein
MGKKCAAWLLLLILTYFGCQAQRFPIEILSMSVDGKVQKVNGGLTYSNTVMWLTVDSVDINFKVNYIGLYNPHTTIIEFENCDYKGFAYVTERQQYHNNNTNYYIVMCIRSRLFTTRELLIRFTTKDQRL